MDGDGKLDRNELEVMLGVSRRITVQLDDSGNIEPQEARSAVTTMLAHLDEDQDGALSLDEFSLGIRTYPALVKMFARYNPSEIVRVNSSRRTTGAIKEQKSTQGGDPNLAKKSDAPLDDGCLACNCVLS